MCIRDRLTWERYMGGTHGFANMPTKKVSIWSGLKGAGGDMTCLLYTSPSPRDGLLSISSAASDVYKRQADLGALHGRHPRLRQYADEEGLDLVRAEGRRRGHDLSLIHISEPTRRTPLYFVGSVRCV